MDTSASDIRFDANGVCNYCTDFLARSSHIIHAESGTKQRQLEAFVERIKREGHGKRYDCIVGVSGGVDSSWVLVQVVELGLRPLAVHMDNGWNSELAQNNIANLVQGLGVDLYTHVIDWPEYRALMQAFFDADVIDVELLYDNAMLAVNYQQAEAHGVKWILSGSNQATEGM
ncbi:ExsB family protein, partial [Pusillimonas sp. T2]